MSYRLARLPRGVAIVDRNGLPTPVYQKWWQSLVEDIETALNSLQDAIDAIQAAQDAADAANAAALAASTAADTAQTAADTAQGVADTTLAEQNLVNSYVSGLTFTAADAGTDASITVSNHTRVYGDLSTLAITGATITGLAYSTFYYVYYVDATRADTTPTFLATTSQTTAAQTGDTHLIGAITTPAALASATNGDFVKPPRISEFL